MLYSLSFLLRILPLKVKIDEVRCIGKVLNVYKFSRIFWIIPRKEKKTSLIIINFKQNFRLFSKFIRQFLQNSSGMCIKINLEFSHLFILSGNSLIIQTISILRDVHYFIF